MTVDVFQASIKLGKTTEKTLRRETPIQSKQASKQSNEIRVKSMKTSKASSMLPIGARVAVKYLKVVDIRIECHSLCFISFLHVNTAAAAVY